MKIKKIGEAEIIMSNPHSKAHYFGWPSVARLQSGKIAAVASGYRHMHVCPFGKAVISYSEDEGRTFTHPAPIIDTPLDDRDAGILPFGEKNVIVTSFNNSVQFQRDSIEWYRKNSELSEEYLAFLKSHLDSVDADAEDKYLGSEFAISRDGGITFKELHRSPVTSPHGPCLLADGTILWVGRTFSKNDAFTEDDGIRSYKITPDGKCEYVGAVPDITYNGGKVNLCEPHAIALPDGTVICHIRANDYEGEGDCSMFTLYQTESTDGGKTWSEPHAILERKGGAPAHLMLHSSGTLISTYACREEPFGIKAMFSRDGGKTWDTGYTLYTEDICPDLGYPCSIELEDGSILTVFYAPECHGGPAVIMRLIWKFED